MTAPNGLRALQARAGALDSQLATARYVGRSADEAVTATVTGHGHLIDLHIDDAALTGTRVQKLGISIVEAVQAARNGASDASIPELNALFHAPQAARPESAQSRVMQARSDRSATSHRRPVRDEADHEVSFDEVDFLSDDEEDDHR
ncbi:YbaB/EbfC family nucleoid-associated protein [Amycolatopsis keratiniphila]|uniref:YbaB/EbfC family nucleoid-associated protein n=1 Tax=Amycolatopsis keratiniphila TaxID=129921 RepID=UPI0033EF9348